MDYCISDIHGQYDLFCRLMDRIDFGSGDRLFVMGDMIDKGPDSVRLVKLVFSMPDVYPIAGNHEHAFLGYCHNLMRESDDFDAVLDKLKGYFTDGALLTWDIIEQLDALAYYTETERFIGVHAGLKVKDGRLLSPAETPVGMLVGDRGFKEPGLLPEGGKCVFFGHTPAWYVTGGKNGILFYPRVGAPERSTRIEDYCKVHLDTDVCFTGVLGCVAVDTCECFYVQNK